VRAQVAERIEPRPTNTPNAATVADAMDAIERAGWRLRDLVDGARELVEVGVTPHRF
jgi:hypothetical protein